MPEPVSIASQNIGNNRHSSISAPRTANAPLADPFLDFTRDLVKGKEEAIVSSWCRLLRQLKIENNLIAQKEHEIIPEISFDDLEAECEDLRDEIQKRGMVIVRGVLPEEKAFACKNDMDDCSRKSPTTQGTYVFNCAYHTAKLRMRSHPSILKVQCHLMAFLWDTCPETEISLTIPLASAGRACTDHRIDDPLIDGESTERWVAGAYRKREIYENVFEGEWESYDPWDASGRAEAVNNLYDGLGAPSMFKLWQGWLSMSYSGTGEGRILVNPLIQLTTAYLLLRPFFRPINEIRGPGFLDEDNWIFTGEPDMTSELHGAAPGHSQELNDALHPHLELHRTMVHLPPLNPGDFVAWHCDSIHALDKTLYDNEDCRLLSIPVCPVTKTNAICLAGQRAALRGNQSSDLSGAEEGAEKTDQPSEEVLRSWTDDVGKQAFGLEGLVTEDIALPGERRVIEKANRILGFQCKYKSRRARGHMSPSRMDILDRFRL
ncbi:DUF1479 domain protein [Aspergillus steynii IBT 23096]|uniref:DUF1479 domain protein n=1 Tax=Aspergillus steynii IBT 23096 TaxID=1392250 RepID=A0A2I2G701_9EURO|nr:DUF1479 domain protein [Aspergillus steynii IBT 23096]PLB48654.1 DUF1479 domain protein [Aspergillus steynii IBT 23096]